MLREMGYSNEDSILALRICDNNLENAATFLLSNPNPSQNMPASMIPRAQPQPGSVGNVTQLAQQTQQRTQALFQDVSRLEEAIQ